MPNLWLAVSEGDEAEVFAKQSAVSKIASGTALVSRATPA
jgi:hypothetical protein